MPRAAVGDLKVRSDRAWAETRPWYGLYYQAYLYASPGMNPYLSGGGATPGRARGMTRGQPVHQLLHDGTLVRSTERLPNRMVSELFPAGRDWADFHPGAFLLGDEEGGNGAVAEALSITQKRVYANLHASNVSLQLVAMVSDGVIAGTGLMKVGLAPDTGSLLHFEAVSQAEVALEKGPMGKVWGFYRQACMTRDHIVATWPDAESLPEQEKVGESGKEPMEYDLIEATYYDPSVSLWYTDVLIDRSEGTGGDPERIVERESAVCPWIAYRYSLRPGEVRGRSPVMAALPDARVLNHAKRVRLETASMRVAGIYTFLNDSTFNPRTARLRSGAFWAVGSNSRDNPTIRALEMSGDVQMGELISNDATQSVKDAMLDFALPDPAGPVRSPTEIVERQAEARQARGMPYLRLMEEAGRPMLRAATWLLLEAGQLPELEEVLAPMQGEGSRPLLMDGTDVALQFVSPQVQAQGYTDAEKTITWGETSKALVGEAAFEDTVRVERIPGELGENFRVNPELLRSEEEAEQRTQARIEARNAQAMPPGGAPMGGSPMGAAMAA